MLGCWCGYRFGARCTFAYGPADPTATHCLLLQEIQIGFGFTLLVSAHPGSPRQNPESRKMVVVVVVVVSNELKRHSNQWTRNPTQTKPCFPLGNVDPNLIHRCLNRPHSLMALCTFTQLCNKVPIGYNGMPHIHSLPPNQQRQSTEGKQ